MSICARTIAACLLLTTSVAAQDAQQGGAPPPGAPSPATSTETELPNVEIIQNQASTPTQQQAAPAVKPKPQAKPVTTAAKPPKPKTKPVPQPVAELPIDDEPTATAEILEPAQIMANSPYGAIGGAAAAQRAVFGAVTPINARQAIPGDLQNFTSAATRVDAQKLGQQRPLTNHEALASVPGVTTVNDDGMGRHSGIGMRGSPMRRSRKILVMEDGLPINFATYLDSSTHYTPPTERIESIEVLRGPVVNYGPLTNHGLINFRNLSPFGENETVIKAAIGHTDGSDKGLNNFRHVHTRQNLGNAGIVASYSGAEGAGAWNNEELRYNDFYGAIGLKGSKQDVIVSGGYFRQRDQYDEFNFVPNDEDSGLADFFANGRSKAGSPFFFDGSTALANLSSYNADYWRVQATHNLYIDDATTITSRAFYSDNQRNRYFVNADRGEFDEASFFMRGRERGYTFYGAESRVEFADKPFIAGMTQDIQVGVKFERQELSNCNAVGLENEVLDAENSGRCDVFTRLDEFNNDRSRFSAVEADSFSAFIQTAIHVNKTLTIVPGLRFEDYEIARNSIRPDDGTSEQEGFTKSDHSVVLPMVGFAWEAMSRTTVYGGYHQGITPHITRGPAFELPDEKGDNFQIGVRSTAFQGLSFDMAYFHSDIENYQTKNPSAADGGNNIFGALDEVRIDGIELGARVDSKPFTGGAWNLFSEATYTYANSRVRSGVDGEGEDATGNLVPEVPRHFANLTFGVAHAIGWDASITWAYRGGFFTDIANQLGLEVDVDEGEVEAGFVDDVWILSARSNFKLNDKVTIFVSGSNLTNEFYLSDIDEGLKPGIARTISAGFVYKF